MNTRGLTGMTTNRAADTDVDFVYNVLTALDDGSSTNDPIVENLKGSVTALQPKDIQRLQEGGTVVKNGITLLVSKARDLRPDKIIIDSQEWRIVNWSFVREYLEDNGGSGFTSRGTAVAICDEILTGSAT